MQQCFVFFMSKEGLVPNWAGGDTVIEIEIEIFSFMLHLSIELYITYPSLYG